MKRPAIFFDRDNTLIVSDGYLGDPSGVVLVEGAADALARARALGYATVVVSNQSGVARGMFTEEAVHAVNARMDELLHDENPAAVIDRHEFCPFHPDASIDHYRRDSDLRKPKPGMIFSAAEKLALDLPRSWLIGDAPRDIEAGKAAGCRTILIRDARHPASPAATEASAAEPDFIAGSLGAALGYIEQHHRPSDDETSPSDAPEPSSNQAMPDDVPSQTEQPAPIAPEPAAPLAPPRVSVDLSRLEDLTSQVLHELRRRHEQAQTEFSVSKLFAGIVQVLVLAVLFVAYLNFSHGNAIALLNSLVFALVLQTLTVALLIMSRQK